MTPRQQQLIDFVRERQMQGLPSPSYQEIIQVLGLKSKSGAHRLVMGLVTRGRLVADFHELGFMHSRSLRLPEPPRHELQVTYVNGLIEVSGIADPEARWNRACEIIRSMGAAP